MPNKIPEDQYHLYDGYDGSTPNNRVDMDALLAAAPQHIKDRIAEREKEVNWVLIENDGALFRGPSRGNPMEVWSTHESRFVPYAMAGQPRDVSWGTVVTAGEAAEIVNQQCD